jgi:hypothetical protein
MPLEADDQPAAGVRAANRTAVPTTSLPELENRTRSTPGTASVTLRAASISSS